MSPVWEILLWVAVIAAGGYASLLAGKGLSMPNRWCSHLSCWRPRARGSYYCARHGWRRP